MEFNLHASCTETSECVFKIHIFKNVAEVFGKGFCVNFWVIFSTSVNLNFTVSFCLFHVINSYYYYVNFSYQNNKATNVIFVHFFKARLLNKYHMGGSINTLDMPKILVCKYVVAIVMLMDNY